MKIKKLVLHNIASIEDATIDFEHGPLAEDSCFLICGPTGSGKSTLLDAICMALYGTTPRLKEAKAGTFDDVSEESVTIHDSRMLMRRGSGEACIELTFTDKDDILLKSVWRCWRSGKKPTGRLQDVNFSLLDVKRNEAISNSKSGGMKIIEQRIGLTFEQFCRTTMLAQGDFTKFLKSDDKTKADILEKLTGTEIYSEIGRRIFAIKGEKEKARDLIKMRLEGVHLLTEEERTEVLKQSEDLQKQIRQLTEEGARLTAMEQWLLQLDALNAEWVNVKRLYEQNKAAAESERSKKIEKMLADWDHTPNQRLAWKNREKAQQEVAACKRDEQFLQKEYVNLAGGWLFLQQQIEQKVRQKGELQAYLQREKSHEDCYRQMALIQSAANQHKQASTALRTVVEERSKNENLLKNLTGQLLNQQQTQKEVKQQTLAHQEKVAAADVALKKLNVGDLLARQKELTVRKSDLDNFRMLTEQWLLTCTEVQKKELEMRQSEVELKGLSAEVEKAGGRAETLQKQYEEQHAVYEKQKQACEDMMKEIRSTLSEGEICPLCGQKIVHLQTDEGFVSILRPVELQLNRLQTDWQSAKDLLNKRMAQLQESRNSQTRISRELAEVKEKEQLLNTKRRSKDLYKELYGASDLSGALTKDDGILAIIDAAVEKVKNRLAALALDLEKVDKAQNLLSALQKEQNELEKSLRKAENAVSLTEKEQERIKGLLQTVETQRQTNEKIRKEAEELLAKYMDLGVFLAQGEAYVNQLEMEATTFLRKEKELQAMEVSLKSEQTECDAMGRCKQAVEQMHAEWTEGAMIPAYRVADLSALWSKFQNEVVRNESSRKQAEKNMLQEESLLKAYWTAADSVSEERLGTLMKLLPEQIERYRNELQGIRDSLLQHQTNMQTIANRLEKHRMNRPEMEADWKLEDVRGHQKVQQESLNGSNRSLGNLQSQLAADEKNKKDFASIQQQLNEAGVIADKWGHLSSIFGSSTGDKFSRIAQSFVLEQLLINANEYLHRFTNRYDMVCQPGSLTILLKDREAGGTERPTSTVSGGESFLFSLSLALGLSSLSRASFSMDMLFIDEGFGTLDGTNLSAVMDALERLHQMGGKKIGIISHVDSLKERLTTQIQVTRVNNTLSKVNVVSLI